MPQPSFYPIVPPAQEDFKAVVVEATGFVYAPERPKEDTFVGQKWGWTAKKAGKITLLLNVTCVVHVSAGGGWTAKKAGALLLAGCVSSA